MIINSIQDAFKQLDTQKHGIPFEGIRYLYNHERDEEISNKILFSLNNAYNSDIYYDSKLDHYFDAPLWYSIVAENHIDEALIDPIIKFYTGTNEDWDFLNEQGNYLIGKTCDVLGDVAVERYINAICEQHEKDSESPYLYLMSCFEFADEEKYYEQLKGLLSDPETLWLDSLITQVSESHFTKLLPQIKNIHNYYQQLKEPDIRQQHTIIELEAAIKELETPIQDTSSRSYYQSRKHWEQHYKKFENRFKEQPTELIPPIIKKKKVGRNEPCPCGSGKKYKKCCWPN